MKLNLLLCGSVLLTALVAQASPVLTTGTPGDANLATPTGPLPPLSNLINFDNVTVCTATPCASLTVQGVTFSSPDGLSVIPFSTQSFPNELFDDSSNGTAGITIDLSAGVTAIGVGIADSDGTLVNNIFTPVNITLQALNSIGGNLGSPFTVTIAETGANPGNGYFVVSDTTPDIYGLQIVQSVGNTNFSGLAIDDLQSTPEPASYLLVASGVVLLICSRMRKSA